MILSVVVTSLLQLSVVYLWFIQWEPLYSFLGIAAWLILTILGFVLYFNTSQNNTRFLKLTILSTSIALAVLGLFSLIVELVA